LRIRDPKKTLSRIRIHNSDRDRVICSTNMILDLLFLFFLHELLILLCHLRTVEVAEVEGQALRGVGQQLQLRILKFVGKITLLKIMKISVETTHHK
jgi:hypothetical protein